MRLQPWTNHKGYRKNHFVKLILPFSNSIRYVYTKRFLDMKNNFPLKCASFSHLFFSKVKKAIKIHSDDEILAPPKTPRGRIGSTTSLSSLRLHNNDSGSDTPRLKTRKKKKSTNGSKSGSLKLSNKN